MRIIFAFFVLLLLLAGLPETARADGYYANGGGYIPVFPRYPYRSGHYPKADWYYQLPPYAAIDPSFYRRRFFMMAQERDRYRYMPHIFHGYSDGEQIEDIDIQGISGSLKETYGTTDRQ
ncbi:MAG TPA: hypothetical protein VKD02_01335 [Methyloceanibacter sp.]|nr:hypothetical protein [Methyloceanibacter sp.]